MFTSTFSLGILGRESGPESMTSYSWSHDFILAGQLRFNTPGIETPRVFQKSHPQFTFLYLVVHKIAHCKVSLNLD